MPDPEKCTWLISFPPQHALSYRPIICCSQSQASPRRLSRVSFERGKYHSNEWVGRRVRRSQARAMDFEKVAQATETLDVAYEISRILDTGLDKETLSLLIGLCENGVNPEVHSFDT